MQITRAKLKPYQLPLSSPWKSSKGTLNNRHGWLISLTDTQGHTGYGDAAPLPEIGTETPQQAEEWLNSQLSTLMGGEPEQCLHALPYAETRPAGRFGLETALLDLHAKQRGIPIYQLLTNSKPIGIRINASIGSLEAGIEARTHAALCAGFTTLKLKLGLYPLTEELAALQKLCKGLPAGCQLRLDANQAWHEEGTDTLIQGLEGLPIESLEEPFSDFDLNSLRKLQAAVPFDLALDESLPVFLHDHPLADLPVKRIIIKPTLLGGILSSLKLIREADQQGIHCVITSSLESSVGIWPLLHLAAAADIITQPAIHGLATANLFSRDLGNTPLISNGLIRLEDVPGSGFILST
jgi:o-succinylbenzoate synthase